MSNILKALAIVVLLCAIPMRQVAQTPSRTNQQESIEFDITDIDLFDERIIFMYNLVNDSRFDVIPSENDGVFIIYPDEAFEGMNLRETFTNFRNQKHFEFLHIDKETATELAYEYKSLIPKEYFLSLMMDYYIQTRQNNLCANADPFCTDNGLYQFPAGVNAGSGESGPNYNCLSSTPNPAWYYMRIANPGNINIQMYSEPSRDIDFCCWGPFTDPTTPCPTGLVAGKVVSCSYSTASIENCQIPSSAQTGEYYILIITNYSNNACNITFSKTGGTGTTDCGIMPPLVGNGGPYCVGETIRLQANTSQQGASFSWTGPGGFTSTQQNPTRPNCTMAMAGTYTCTITIGSQSNNATTQVVVNPEPVANFTYTSVCKGTPTQFTSTSTTNPSGQQITSYEWTFGDGQSGNGATVSHTYANAGNYQVKLKVKTANGACDDEKTQTVPVYAKPIPTASALPNTVMYGGTAQLSANAGVAGSFNYHWEPANKVVNPNAQSTQTVALYATQQFTCTVTNPQGGCNGTAQVTVSMEGSGMTATATADDYELCEGESTNLHAQPSGGTGNYTYSWTPTTGLNNPNVQNPVATPPVGTNRYNCHVSDGVTEYDVNVSIVVHPNTSSHITHSICPDESYDFFGTTLTEPGTYQHTVTNHFGCDSIINLTLQHYETYNTSQTVYVCQGEPYHFGGTDYYNPGQYPVTFQTVHGCDSVVTLNLFHHPTYDIHLSEGFCDGSEYEFHGQTFNQPGDYEFHEETVNGCDSLVTLHLYLNAFNTKTYNISRCNEPYTWPSTGEEFKNVGEYHVVDTLIIEDACDSIVILNLNIYQDYKELSFSHTDCDNYTWPNYGGLSYYENGVQSNEGKTYTHSGEYTRHYQTTHGCDSIITMNLTINYSDVNHLASEDACNSYNWADAGIVFDQSETLSHVFNNVYGCDSIVHKTINMEYTPNPKQIGPADYNNVWPHWIIPATEFQINVYSYSIEDGVYPGACHWDSINWHCQTKSGRIINWPIEKKSEDGKVIDLYVLNFESDTVYLTATIFNRCAPQGVVMDYWLVCSFYGIEEQEASLANFDVVPNPNNGQMTLNFEYLTGKVNIKVYDMKGNLIDDFDNYNGVGPNSMSYDMSAYSNGMYFFVVTAKEGTVTKKVIINK